MRKKHPKPILNRVQNSTFRALITSPAPLSLHVPCTTAGRMIHHCPDSQRTPLPQPHRRRALLHTCPSTSESTAAAHPSRCQQYSTEPYSAPTARLSRQPWFVPTEPIITGPGSSSVPLRETVQAHPGLQLLTLRIRVQRHHLH